MPNDRLKKWTFFNLFFAFSDVNECSRGTHKCNPTQICKNYLGYYTCECPPGHHFNKRTEMCEDMDECKIFRVSHIEAVYMYSISKRFPTFCVINNSTCVANFIYYNNEKNWEPHFLSLICRSLFYSRFTFNVCCLVNLCFTSSIKIVPFLMIGCFFHESFIFSSFHSYTERNIY